MTSNRVRDRGAALFRYGDQEPSTRPHDNSQPAATTMGESRISSLPSLFRDFAGLSLTSRKNKSRSDQFIKEPEFTSGFGQWTSSLRKKRPKEKHRHRSHVQTEDDDIDTVIEERDHERKLLRGALRELEELRRDRDDVDHQRAKATTVLKRLRKENSRKDKKIDDYHSRLHDQEVALECIRANFQASRIEAGDKDGKIEQLANDLDNAKYKSQKLRDKLKRERDEVSRLCTVLSDLRAQKVPAESQDHARSLRASRRSHDDLRRRFEASQDDIKTLKAEEARIEKECTRLRAERDDTKHQILNVEVENANQAQAIKSLTKSKLALEKDRDLVQPILQIGVDIRLRNLESARESLLKIKQAERDRAIILSGNVAAHRPNGAVDAALFVAGLVPADYLPEAIRAFKKMYQVAPAKYGCWSPMVLRMIDCQATIATVQIQHHFKKFDTSHLRAEHDRLHGFLLSRQKRLSAGEFEADEKAKELLAKIEDIMEEIVDLSRGKGKGRKKFETFDYEETEDEKTKLKVAPPNAKRDEGKVQTIQENKISDDEEDTSNDSDSEEEDSDDNSEDDTDGSEEEKSDESESESENND